jgi:hypothetical protein
MSAIAARSTRHAMRALESGICRTGGATAPEEKPPRVRENPMLAEHAPA